MSHHECRAQLEGREYSVSMGYDRGFDGGFYLVVNERTADGREVRRLATETPLYDIEAVRTTLSSLNLQVPESMFEESVRDRAQDCTRRMMLHSHDQPPVLL